MDRMACVNIHALPLQLLLHRHPEWHAAPVVVVDRDKPTGVILWANELATARHIVPGMRYAAGLSLARKLQGGVVGDTDIGQAVASITQRLWCFSPRVEPSPHEHGVFWLDASGMRHLYPSLDTWATRLCEDLSQANFRAVAAVGFTRFGSYAAAKASATNMVLHSPEEEQAYLRGVTIEQLGLAPHLRDTLFKLDIGTLGRFIDLPSSGIRKRFGEEAAKLHRLARNDGWAPLDPLPIDEPVECTEELDYQEANLERLLVQIASMLEPLLLELAARHEKLKLLQLSFTLDDRNELHTSIAPAMPTHDANQILALVRLRLDSLPLSAGVTKLTLHTVGIAITQQQLHLFHDAPRGNLDAVYRAFAKVRTELGEDAVAVAQLHEGHLPEARYSWAPLQQLSLPKPAGHTAGPLVRRIYSPPIPLPARNRREPDGWLIAGTTHGPVEEVIGPYLVCGGWWVREVSRAYYYVRTQSGRWLWIFHDHRRRRWFLQGEVQ